MSYDDEQNRYRCDGPGCGAVVAALSGSGWLETAHHTYSEAAIATAFHFCSRACKRRRRGLGDAIEQAAYKVDCGEAILSEAVAEVVEHVLVLDRDWDPEGSRAVELARLVGQAWHVFAGQVERKLGTSPSSIDEALVGGDGIDPGTEQLMGVLSQTMMAQGARASRGELTIPQAVDVAVQAMMPHLRRLSMRRPDGLPSVVRELTTPFRLAATFQVELADALDRAYAAIVNEHERPKP